MAMRTANLLARRFRARESVVSQEEQQQQIRALRASFKRGIMPDFSKLNQSVRNLFRKLFGHSRDAAATLAQRRIDKNNHGNKVA